MVMIPETRVLVVGCGSIGKRHARLLTEVPQVEVLVCDALEENLQAALEEAPGSRGFRSYEQALAEEPHAVFVCTPNHLHRPMAVAALEAGCHVMCEKPLADTLENAEAIAEAAERAETMLQVGYSMRSHSGIRRLRELVEQGVCGNIIGGRAMVGTYFTLMCATTDYRMTEENALIIDYTHLLDYLALLIGPIARVSAESATLGDLPMMPSPNVFSAILTHESGAISQFHADYVQHPQRSLTEVFGDERVLSYDAQHYELRIFHRDRPGYEVERVVTARDDIYRVQIAEFLEAIHGEMTPVCTAVEGVAALRAALAAVRSAREHRAVELSEV
ncbi:MAG: Gfo/Idh/MocA family protein [Armatimonadota bacterium]|jgi:predicted dehydrogenase